MKKLDLVEVKRLLVEMQVQYLTSEEDYTEDEATEEAVETANEELAHIESIEVEDNQEIILFVDNWCNEYYAIRGNYIVTLTDGRKFVRNTDETTSLFEVVELTSYDLKEVA